MKYVIKANNIKVYVVAINTPQYFSLTHGYAAPSCLDHKKIKNLTNLIISATYRNNDPNRWNLRIEICMKEALSNHIYNHCPDNYVNLTLSGELRSTMNSKVQGFSDLVVVMASNKDKAIFKTIYC